MVNGTFKHRSFKRSYREDYIRELKIPSIAQHIFETFKTFFENWKILLPILLISTIFEIFMLGFLNESNFYDVGVGVVTTINFLMVFLTTIFAVRQKMVKHKIGLRDTLYNATTPLIATLVILMIAAVECVPVMLVIIAYASAVETNFLATPFYALLFLVFAALMFLLAGYLLSSSLMALVAVTAPGLYPLEAMKAASDLMVGRRIRFVVRLIAIMIVLGLLWVIIVWPIGLAMNGTPVMSVVVTVMGVFSSMIFSIYFYLFYRWMIDKKHK